MNCAQASVLSQAAVPRTRPMNRPRAVCSPLRWHTAPCLSSPSCARPWPSSPHSAVASRRHHRRRSRRTPIARHLPPTAMAALHARPSRASWPCPWRLSVSSQASARAKCRAVHQRWAAAARRRARSRQPRGRRAEGGTRRAPPRRSSRAARGGRRPSAPAAARGRGRPRRRREANGGALARRGRTPRASTPRGAGRGTAPSSR
mmetsp:Transcript_8916/g.21401  ORF Transcript_8916/g.21401 Transcript_8916/m.21401 type:complete len:204 (+) Transcript_8916:604-1215(+)